jgi:hypothetical protein
MKRYFMTIPEASQLVLQAGAMGQGGEIFILDMGEPVSIAALAEDMIRLSGFRPNQDIAIVVSGLRPGEKLFEELGTSADKMDQTRHPKIFVGKIPAVDRAFVLDAVNRLEDAVHTLDEQGLRDQLSLFVPEARLGPANGRMQAAIEKRSRRGVALLLWLILLTRGGALLAQAAPTSASVPRQRQLPVKEQVKVLMEEARYHLGPVRFQPGLALRNSGYNNNLFGTESEPVGDWTATVAAGGDLLIPVGSKVFFKGRAFPEYTWYADLVERRGWGWQLGGSVLGFFNRLTLEAGVDEQKVNEMVSSEVERPSYHVFTVGRGRLEVEVLRRFSVFAGGEQQRTRYPADPGAANVQLADLDRTDTVVRGGVRYRFREYFDLAGMVEETRSEFVRQPVARDSKSRAYLLTVHYDRPRFYLDLSGGLRQGRSFGDSAFAEYDEPTGGFFASYLLNRRVELQVFGAQQPVNSLYAANPYYIESRVGGAAVFTVGSRVKLEAFAETGWNRYPLEETPTGTDTPVKRKDGLVRVGGGLGFRFYRTATLTAKASWDTYSSNLPGFDRKIFRITTGLVFGDLFSRPNKW